MINKVKSNYLYILIISTMLLFGIVSGCKKPDDSSALVSTSTSIKDHKVFINALAKEQNIPVVFPQLIPRDDAYKRYYLSREMLLEDGFNRGYIISVGYTEDCNGVHVCTVGYLLAQRGMKPENALDRDNKNITESVMLAYNIKGYFTPGHAMGSYFQPMLQWNLGDILYTLSWDDKLVDVDALKAMANSSITQIE